MVGKIIQAPDFIEVDGPMIFLGGPIRGTYRWHDDAIAYIHQIDPEIHIATPCSYPFHGNHGLQNDWVVRNQERAAEEGSLLFWMSRETGHKCNRSYAQEARFELGEWAANSWRDGVKLVVGIENGFTGGAYLHERLKRDYPNIPLCRMLRQSCLAAVEMARGRTSKWSQLREFLI